MKIAILTTTTAWGGVEIHTLALVRALVTRGHRVTILELDHDVYSQHIGQNCESVRVLSLKRQRADRQIGYLEGLRLIHQFADHICVFPKNDFDAGNLRLDFAIRRWFRRYVTIEHTTPPRMPPRITRSHFGGLLPGLGTWWYRLLIPRIARSISPDLTITVSKSIKEGLVQQYHFPPYKVITLHNGIDLSKFQPNSERRQRVRTAWGIPASALVFGGIGRIDRFKGHDLTINAFTHLARSSPRATSGWCLSVRDPR